MLDANPHMIETISLYARVAALATCSRLDWTLMILIIPLPYILWIMALHTKLCFRTYLQSFFHGKRDIPRATCGITVDMVVVQLVHVFASRPGVC